MDRQLSRILELIAAEPTSACVRHGAADQLQRLCAAAARSLDARGVDVCLMAGPGGVGLVVASDDATERLAELQVTLGEGPGIDAFTTRRHVACPQLGGAGQLSSWPAYSAALHAAGVRAVFSFPLQVGAGRLGVLDVFRDAAGGLTPPELVDALTFADVAVTMLLDAQAAVPAGEDQGGIDLAFDHRAELYQAQGMVMVALGVTLAEALVRLRAHAFAINRPLIDVAADVVSRVLALEQDGKI